MRNYDKLLLTAVLLAATVSGCRTKDCVDDTLLVSLTLQGAAAAADSLKVSVSIDGGAAKMQTVPTNGEHGGNLQIDFPTGYPRGLGVAVTIDAVVGNTVVATGGATKTLMNACETLAIVVGMSGDGGADDMSCTPTVTTCPADACGKVSDGCSGFVTCATPCQVTSLSPALANTGDNLVVEGLFFGETTVDFPGAPGQAATLLGANRLVVPVPATATAGDLKVNSGNTALGPMYFRRASYPLAWNGYISGGGYASEPQGDVGRRPTHLVDGREFHTLINVNDWLVAIGGRTSNGPLSTVEVGLVNADGTAGLFTTLTTALALPVFGHTTHLLGSSIHVIGGNNGSSIYDSNQRATVAADGSISDFTVTGEPKLSTARWSHVSIVVGNYLYVIGGTTAMGDAATVERAPINPDGTLGSFAAYADAMLTQPRHGGGVFATRSAVYVVGGLNGNTALASVESAPIAADGSIGSFSVVTAVVLSTPQAVESAMVIGGAVYSLGSGSASTIERAPINADGTLQAFSSLGTNNASPDGAAAVVRDVIFWSGGYDDGYTSGVLRGSFNASGNLAAFALNSTQKLADKRSDAVTFVSGNYVYMVGGRTTTGITAAVQRSLIAPDDSLVGWENVSGVALTTPRQNAAGVIYEDTSGTTPANYLYITGGVSPTAPALATIERAPIAVDGTMGAFEAVNFPMNTPRFSHRVVIGGSYPTVVGGATSNGSGLTPLTTVEIPSSGFPSNWYTQSSAYSLKAARFGFGLVAAGNQFWAMGSNGLNTIEQVDANYLGGVGVGTWLTSGITSTVNKDFNVLSIGPFTYLVGASTSIGRTKLGVANPASFAVTTGTGLQLARQNPGSIVVGNAVHVFGGDVSGPVDSLESARLQ